MFKSKKKRSPKRMKEMDILLKKIELLKQEKKLIVILEIKDILYIKIQLI